MMRIRMMMRMMRVMRIMMMMRMMTIMMMMMRIMMMMLMMMIKIEFLNELMSHPTIDGGHCSEPYLPTEPAELLQSGDYATEVDVLIGEGEGRDGATFVLILVL